MADNVQISDGLGGTVTASTDEAASGQIQRVKLTYSADGSDTHIGADASGLLVNLGSNNDVTLTAGTLTAISGTVTTSVSGTASVAVASLPALASGSNLVGYVGISADGTAVADILSLTNGTAVAVGILDQDGDQLAFASPTVLSVTPTLSTSPAYGAGDAVGTVMSFSNAAATNGGTGSILRATFYDFDDLTHDGTNGRYRLDLYTTTVSVTDNSSYIATIDDTEAGTYIGSIDTDDAGSSGAGWIDLGAAKVCTVSTTLPLAYKCAATTLFGVLVAVSADSGVSSASGKRVDLQVVQD